tara:strand:+ start:55970 stop:56326 length:357 start_codon:yes stop_codon:yes gene_type:complete
VAAHVLADSVQIRGRIFDDSGVAVSPLLYITSTGRNERPSVAWVRAAHAYAIVWEDGHRIRGLLHDEITGVAVMPLKTISQAPINGRDQRAESLRSTVSERLLSGIARTPVRTNPAAS